jgi:hypothetical protein
MSKRSPYSDPEVPSFAEHYCRRHGIYHEGFLLVVLQRTLYPHVRPIFSLMLQMHPQLFSADFDFVVALGRTRSYSDFEFAAQAFCEHPANRGFLRRSLRMRISVRRVRRLLNEIYTRKMFVIPEEISAGDSLSPFVRTTESISVRSLTTSLAPRSP